MAVDTPTDGQIAAYQASSGEFEWVDDSSGSPGGSADEIQYNDGAGGFAGDSGFVMNVKGSGSTTKIRVGNIITGANGIQTNATNGSIFVTADGAGQIFLQSGSDAGGTWTDSTVNINCNSGTDVSTLKLRDNSVTKQATIKLDSAGNFDFDNENTNQNIEMTVKGTGQVEVKQSTTNNDSNLLIRGNGTGTPKVTFTNDTKSITLQCDENNKFKVQGALYDFIFDASSASGGITFPDGTTQTTAASSGGVSSIIAGTNISISPVGGTGDVTINATSGAAVFDGLINTAIDATYDKWQVSGMAPFATINGASANYSMNTRPRAFPFIAPFDGNIAEMKINVTTATASAFVGVAIYDANAQNEPGSKCQEASFDASTTGKKTQTSITQTTALVAGNLYWYSFWLYGVSSGVVVDAMPHDSTLGTGLTFDLNDSSQSNSVTGTNLTTGTSQPATFSVDSMQNIDRPHLTIGT
jgi:hypothetical protein